VARVNGMARGGSGVQPAVAALLVEMLNRGVHPVVPGIGSIGASDICQLAHVGLVVMGEGTAEHRGRTGSGAEALGWAGLDPLILGPKDGPGADDVEDDSTNALLGAQRVAAMAEDLRLVLAIEALVAAQAVEAANPARIGDGPGLVLAAVRDRVPALVEDRPCGPDIEEVAAEVLTAGLAARVAALA